MTKTLILRRSPAGGMPTEGRRYQGGQFIPTAVWEAEKAKATADMPGVVKGFGDDLQFLRLVYKQQVAVLALPLDLMPGVERVPLAAVARKMKERIRRAYTDAFTLGKRAAGNLMTSTAEDAFAVQRTRTDEYGYLRAFLRDMDLGDGMMEYGRRMDYYAKASRELFWLGFALADLSPERHIKWELGPTEHCSTCLDMADHGWFSAPDFATVARQGYLPQSGRLACLGYNCQCRLIAGVKGTKPNG